MLRTFIERIVRMQSEKGTTVVGQKNYPVDLRLTNGNILLRAFRIVSLEGNTLKGVTWKEEYSAPREQRETVYSFFDINEIASLSCYELGIEYEKETSKL